VVYNFDPPTGDLHPISSRPFRAYTRTCTRRSASRPAGEVGVRRYHHEFRKLRGSNLLKRGQNRIEDLMNFLTRLNLRLLLVLLAASCCNLGAPGIGRANQSSEDVAAVAQITIDIESLQQYFHEDELPERSPLVVVSDLLARQGAKLEKFGLPVVLKAEADVADWIAPHLRFSIVSMTADQATVEFSYRIEGIRGTARLNKRQGKWQVVVAEILER